MTAALVGGVIMGLLQLALEVLGYLKQQRSATNATKKTLLKEDLAALRRQLGVGGAATLWVQPQKRNGPDSGLPS